jgi:predicted hotdog family 3-hydroxylacyl-ACP dehydratase
VIDKTAICNMLPHAGSMCLLDTVVTWNPKQITCSSRSHLLAENPLRNTNELPMLALMEYGAQAMAVHGCLLAQANGVSLQEGYLAALRDVKVMPGDLALIEDTLIIHAEKIYVDNASMIYNLAIRAGARQLASGRATAVGKFSRGEQG